MQKIFVALNKAEIVQKYMAEISNELNGHFEVHLFPKIIEQVNEDNSEDIPYYGAIAFMQDGCFYSEKIKCVSIFNVRDLINEYAPDMEGVGDYDCCEEFEMEEAIKYDKYIVGSNIKESIVDEELGIEYKIILY